MDKLNGRITQEFFDRQAATLRRELDGLLCKIQGIQKSALAPDANWEFGSPNFETWL